MSKLVHWLKGEFGNIAIAVSLAAFVCVVLPVQTYLANASLFVFTPGRLAVELAILFVAMAAAAWLLLATVGRFLGGFLQAVFVAALVCVYLESGILSAGLPELNGGLIPALAVKSRMIIDLAVWTVVLISFLAVARWARAWLHWVALAFLVLAIASLFDVRREQEPTSAPTSEDGLSSGFEWQRDVIENFRFSPKRNVLVFILDSMPGNLSYDFVTSDPGIAKAFAGFTAFTNNVGMADCTKYGLPGLMTGLYFEPGVSSAADYPMSIFGEESFIVPYVKRGSEVFFVNDLLPYGYANGPITKRLPVKGKQKHGWAALLLRSKEVPYLSLFDTVVFRLSPYCVKAPFLYSKIRHDPMMGHDESAFWYEHVMFPILGRAPLSKSTTTLGVFHSRGAHPPLVFDPNGKAYPHPRVDPGMIGELVSTPLRHLSKLLDTLRERGLYDSSLIVVVADHGIDLVPFAKGHHPSESAILWVKPEGAKGDFAAVPRPTGYSKVSVLMRKAAEGSLDIRSIGSLLEEHDRLYRYQLGDGFGEHIVGPDGTIREGGEPR